MKKQSLILFFLLPMFGYGQTALGLKGGLNVSDIVMTNFVNPDVEADLGLKAGVHVGFFMNCEVDDRIAMVAELLYSNKGVRGIENIHLHYVAIPLLMQYRLNDRISVELGTEPAYLFSAKSRHGDESGTYNNRLDLSLDGGLRLDTSKMTFGIRYCVGLISVRDPLETHGLQGPEIIKYQNRVLQFTVGYKLFVAD